MNKETISVLNNLAPSPWSSRCDSTDRSVAAESLLSLLRTSPQMPPTTTTTISSGNKRACSTPRIVVPSSPVKDEQQQQQHQPQTKRRKRCSTNKKQVTFAPNEDDLVSFISCPPYVHGSTDGECLQLYRSEIWFTDKDYADFWKDRIDTIRVYRSVRGNMAGLTQHYTVRGLEHYLHFQQHILLQRQQQALVTAVLAEQHRQKIMKTYYDADAMQAFVSQLTSTARQEAVARAAKDNDPKDNEQKIGSCNGFSSSDDDDDSDVESHHEEEEKEKLDFLSPVAAMALQEATAIELNTATAVAAAAAASRPISLSSNFARPIRVNKAALRVMNLRFLQEMQHKLLPTLSSSAAASARATEPKQQQRRISALLQGGHEEIEQWHRLPLLQRHQRRASSFTTQQQRVASSSSGNGNSIANAPFSLNSAARQAYAYNINTNNCLRRASLALARQQGQHQQLLPHKMLMQQHHPYAASTPSLHSLRQQQHLLAARCRNNLKSPLGLDRTLHASAASSPATTPVSICRRDSLSGLR